MEFDLCLLHAPSASGKTTFLTNGEATPFVLDLRNGGVHLGDFLYRFGKVGIVDGDDIIHFTLGWPRDKAWWRKPGATLVHFANVASILNAAARLSKPEWMDKLVVMFNGGMKNVHRAEEFYMGYDDAGHQRSLQHLYVIPTREVHERNIESRKKENVEQGRSWTFPRDWSDAQANRTAVRNMANLKNQEIYETFEAALADVLEDTY